MIDTRNGRVLEEGRRAMVDDDEWAWIEESLDGGRRSPGDRFLAALAPAAGDTRPRGVGRAGHRGKTGPPGGSLG